MITVKLYFAIIASCFGSAFQHGYQIGVMNNPQKVITFWLNKTMIDRGQDTDKQMINLIWSTMTSIYAFGGMFGALLVGSVTHYLSVKWALVFNNILVFVPAVFVILSKPTGLYEFLIAARFILGINAGLFAGLCPIYLNEISPVAKRGAIGSIYQLIITLSILISQCLGYEEVLGDTELWPYLIGVVILVPSIFQCITLPFCPESPRYLLIIRKNDERAENALKWLRNTDDNAVEVSDMRKEAAAQEAAGLVTWRALFTKGSLRTPLIISLMIMLAQQLCGINAIMVYSNEIFQNAGLNVLWAFLGTVLVGLTNFLMTIVSLVIVDHIGRKTLLVIGFGGTAVFTPLLAVSIKLSEDYDGMSILCILCVVGFIISFATGPGSVPWFLVAELFRQDARPKAMSVAVFCNWLANTTVMLTFLPIKYYIGYFVFLIFIIFQVFFLLFIIFRVPETKNKQIEEIAALFKD